MLPLMMIWSYLMLILRMMLFRSNPRRYSRQLVALQDDQRKAIARAAESVAPKNKDKICGCISASGEATRAFKEMMDLSLLKDVVFLMFAVSNFLTSIGFNAPYVYTVVRDLNLHCVAVFRNFVTSCHCRIVQSNGTLK